MSSTGCRCPADSVDVIVCALALVHVPRLEPVLAEFARVLRPGGDLVISDVHHEHVTRGSVITARGPAGEPCVAATYRHPLGDYLRPALSSSVPPAVLTDAWFMGVWTRRFRYEYPARVRLVGVHFKLWGMSPFTGAAAEPTR